ncbi:MAG: hypothetical protein EOP88_03065 [Verrucomicrobiaceae bacterium]|nr:MAG: hypothetical protein EOP88_03065 [Verrucomicrobiaceae bacterium]
MNELAKVCYLHIGTHKTGSTSIQRFLSDSVKELESRGLLCPLFDRGKIDHDHKKLTVALTTFNQHHGNSEILRKLAGMLRNESRDVIISAETLSEKLPRPGVLEPVRKFFADLGYRLHVIVYLRDQASYMNSRYVQEVKRFRYGGSFLSYLEGILGDPDSSFDYWEHYQPFINDPAIGFDPRSFSKAVKTGLLEDFVSTIPGLADGSLLKSYKRPHSMNPNAGTRSVFVARLVTNSIEGPLAGLTERLAPTLRDHFLKHKWYEEPFVGLDETLAKLVERRYAEGNNLLARKFWGCEWDSLNPPSSWERKVFSFSDASPEERGSVLRVAARLMRQIGDPEMKPGKEVPAERPKPSKSRKERPKRGMFSGILKLLGRSKERKLKR